jgi:excisionase family DNA binding protein
VAPDPPASVVIVAQAAPDVCERLEPLLREAMRATVRDLGPDVFTASDWEFVAGMRVLAEGVRRRRAERITEGLSLRPMVDPAGLSASTIEAMEPTEMTVAEAAEKRGCSRSAITKRIRKGTLPARRDELGRLWIRATDLSA